jgi:glyoxylase-like metal-dependent hydrolase (beta-lactamase superfamily II)
MTQYKLHIIKMGQCEVPGPEVYWMSRWCDWETLYFYMILVRGPGVTAVINTGPPADLAELNKLWRAFAGERCQMQRTESECPEKALAVLGCKPEDVTHVFITPLVCYADANLPLFSQARSIFLSRRGWIEDYAAPTSPQHVPRHIFMPDDVAVYLITKAFDRLHFIDDEEEVLPGIRLFWTGVHHRSSMAISIPTLAGRVVVSDCFFKYGNMERNHPIGISESLAEWHRAYARIRREADLVLPLYDPEVLQRHPGGTIG